MKERPILFSAEMVRAILDGRKTQTRRVVKPQPHWNHGLQPMWGESPDTPPVPFGTPYLWREVGPDYPDDESDDRRCPYGQPGDRLWVRETWTTGATAPSDFESNRFIPLYRADEQEHPEAFRWRPSIHMPRWASRITLEITGVRVERVDQISEDDIVAEGTQVPVDAETRRPLLRISGNYLPDRYISRPPQEWTGADWLRAHFASYWDSLNAKRGFGWDANPWVWVIEFKRVDVKPVEAAA